MKKSTLLLAILILITPLISSANMKRADVEIESIEKLSKTIAGNAVFVNLLLNIKSEITEIQHFFKETTGGKKLNELSIEEKKKAISALAKNDVLTKARNARMDLISQFPDLKKMTSDELRTVIQIAGKEAKKNIISSNFKIALKDDSLFSVCIAKCDLDLFTAQEELEMYYVSEAVVIATNYSNCRSLCFAFIPVDNECIYMCDMNEMIDSGDLAALANSRVQTYQLVWFSCYDGCNIFMEINKGFEK